MPAMMERFAAKQKTDRDLIIRLTDVVARIFAGAASGSTCSR